MYNIVRARKRGKRALDRQQQDVVEKRWGIKSTSVSGIQIVEREVRSRNTGSEAMGSMFKSRPRQLANF
jgi:hypothetical protein